MLPLACVAMAGVAAEAMAFQEVQAGHRHCFGSRSSHSRKCASGRGTGPSNIVSVSSQVVHSGQIVMLGQSWG